ncbi:VacJ family lipoprotein [Thiomicrorhabdus sp. zzn3]|uniref:MlaA family lipoprotein n=1 Tax=Thiomicrorhabdus sp. zzn3 TaxID=3039775 RepID=UPI002436A3FD|nr:VacJ family lipoprotein [Thiomicrorhabdus sp. zzn3]MDG6778766.1 VacJ family lipoprotein [Thiomicrorhabdus sp. zzn3]
MNVLVSSAMASWEDDLAPPAKKTDSSAMVMMNPQDPYESYNRKMFTFNMAFHDAIGEPVAKAYLNYVPQPAQTGIQNFFSNLGMPLNVMNSFLQGKGQEGFEGIMRFTLNSTFGLFGLLDIATPAGLELKKEDFGQTLAVWGVWDEASFVMLPFIGPYTTRSLFGWGVDSYSDLLYQMVDGDDVNRPALAFGDAFVSYTKATPLIDELRQQPDPYIFMRESYLQYRTNAIYDGHPPQPKLDDFDFE